MSWHADATLIGRYAAGTLDRANSSSVEEHLLACEQCRAMATHAVDTTRLDRIFAEVRDATDHPRLPATARLLHALGIREHTARLIAATPALTVSWFAAITIALVWAVSVSRNASHGVGLFLIVAPLIPLAGVALAFGPGLDPTYEVGVAAPLPGFRLYLIRAGTVLSTTMLLIGAASFALPHVGWSAAAWLLPALAVASASAAVSTWLSPLTSAAVVGAGWIAVTYTSYVLAGRTLAPSRLAVFEPGGQGVAAALATIAAVVIVARSNRFDIGRNV